MKEFHLIKVVFAVLAIGALAVGLAAADEKTDKGKTANGAAAGDVAKGKAFAEQCEACHDLKGDEKKMGPSLKGLYKKQKLAKEGAGKVTDANVMKIINEGGNGMPAYEDILAEEEKTNPNIRKDLLAFLKTL
jgi:mono/diheme cytochrome c family protein